MNLKNYDMTAATQYSGLSRRPAPGFEGLGGTPKWVGTLNTTYTCWKAMLSLQTRYMQLGAYVSTAAAGNASDRDRTTRSTTRPTRTRSTSTRSSSASTFTLSGTYDIVEERGRAEAPGLLPDQQPARQGSAELRRHRQRQPVLRRATAGPTGSASASAWPRRPWPAGLSAGHGRLSSRQRRRRRTAPECG